MLFVYEANAVVVDLHGLGRVFRPLYLFFVNHDLLNNGGGHEHSPQADGSL